MIPNGTIVTVYEDAESEKYPEGSAEVVDCIYELPDKVGMYRVRFVGDPDAGVLFRRILDTGQGRE